MGKDSHTSFVTLVVCVGATFLHTPSSTCIHFLYQEAYISFLNQKSYIFLIKSGEWRLVYIQVRNEEFSCPAKVVHKRKMPTGGAGSGQRKVSPGGWGAWARTASTNNSQRLQSAISNQHPGTAPQQTPAGNADGAAACDQTQGDDATQQDNNMQRLYGLWQTVAFVRRAEDGKVPRNERGNVEVPPLAKSLPLGELGKAVGYVGTRICTCLGFWG